MRIGDGERNAQLRRFSIRVFFFVALSVSLGVLYIYIVKSCRGGLGVRTMFYYFCVELLCFILLFF